MTMMTAASGEVRKGNSEIQFLIYEACLLLNDEDWNGFLGLCDPAHFRYSIMNYAPEMRRDQIWMDRSWKELKGIIDHLPRHNSDHSTLTRHATVYRVKPTAAATGEFDVTSIFTIYRTQVDGVNSPIESGKTTLYAVGKYLDTVKVSDGGVTLLNRNVRLDTRQLDIGSHYLF